MSITRRLMMKTAGVVAALAMTATSSDFPEVMDTAKLSTGEAINYNMMSVLIQRWVELDPDAALGWVKSSSVLAEIDIDCLAQRFGHLGGVWRVLLHVQSADFCI